MITLAAQVVLGGVHERVECRGGNGRRVAGLDYCHRACHNPAPNADSWLTVKGAKHCEERGRSFLRPPDWHRPGRSNTRYTDVHS